MKSHGFWRSNKYGCGETPARTRVVAFGALTLALLSPWVAPPEARADASGADRAPAAAKADEEYSFDWLDPDKKIYVLQNRRYRKAGRAQLSAMGGFGLSNSYRDSIVGDVRGTYYFSEMFGFEAYYNYVKDSPNSVYEALVQTGTPVLPGSRRIDSSFGAALHYAPWYAKINVFNAILYFDWYFTLGAARLQTAFDQRENSSDAEAFVNEPKTAVVIGTGQQFHLNETWVFRLDLKSEIYRGRVQRGANSPEAYFSNINLTAGVGLRF
jgi:outer membrane beta-barrel protein